MKEARAARGGLGLVTSIAVLSCLAGCAVDAGGEFADDPMPVRPLAVASRTGDVAAEIDAANEALHPDVRAEKYAAMSASPFAFFRGSNHLYWRDLGASPARFPYGGQPSTRAVLAGDMHVDNMGAFDDAEGKVVYALNDLDQAVLADYQLDVWRLAISIVLVARANGGFTSADEATVVDAFSEAYLDAMKAYAASDAERTRTFTEATTYGRLNDFLDDVRDRKSRKKMLDEWTVKQSGVRVLATASHPDLGPVTPEVEAELRAQIPAYRARQLGGSSPPASHFQVKSVARRLHAGLGSLGVARYYVLVEGASASQDDDRILDVKEQPLAAAYEYVGGEQVAATEALCAGNQALRVVLAHGALGYRVDPFLGWLRLSDGEHYSVRERSPWKATFPTEELTSLTRLTKLSEQWGEVLAAHHARSDRDWDAGIQPHDLDATIKARSAGDHAGFRALVRSIAIPYADQVALDHQSFLERF
ncbi:DUF2252 domain-containing protein [Chondromyces crocatus]|uniref:DUF2252 domain-containing protein n=1 Tax=Chondromyces crocatus TaxID=52 RepID=A0A0K1E7J1_CHOCO|nr:DUF2252 family protein [Chondromyces crocatus]AKT36851.1 uncharacterized protein CMC5_009720 [Chondromyces crocatus]